MPQSEDFYISINRSNWAFVGMEAGSNWKNSPGQSPNLVKVRIVGCFFENNERFGVRKA